MKTIGVISDSHDTLTSRKIEKLFPEDSKVITLGDISNREMTIIRERYDFLGGVKGNCDARSHLPLSETIEIHGIRAFLSHEPVPVKVTSRKEDETCGYDMVLFGHLHRRIHYNQNGIVYFSPGAVSGPRDEHGPSAGVIEIKNGRYNFRFVEMVR